MSGTTGYKNGFKTIDVHRGAKDGRPNKIKLKIWDMSGAEFKQTIMRKFFAGSHAFIVVLSVDNPNPFRSLD